MWCSAVGTWLDGSDTTHGKVKQQRAHPERRTAAAQVACTWRGKPGQPRWCEVCRWEELSLIHISEPTRPEPI
eukprot:6537465-Pyramimonas_sp.AAC.1